MRTFIKNLSAAERFSLATIAAASFIVMVSAAITYAHQAETSGIVAHSWNWL